MWRQISAWVEVLTYLCAGPSAPGQARAQATELSWNVPENISLGPIMGPCARRQVFLVELGNYAVPFTFLFVAIVAIVVAHLQMFYGIGMNAFVTNLTSIKSQ